MRLKSKILSPFHKPAQAARPRNTKVAYAGNVRHNRNIKQGKAPNNLKGHNINKYDSLTAFAEIPNEKTLHDLFTLMTKEGFFLNADHAAEYEQKILNSAHSEFWFSNGSTEVKIFVDRWTGRMTLSNFRHINNKLVRRMFATIGA